MADLKLGRLPKVGLVRMTIGIPERLKEELDRYAAQHSRLKEPVDAATWFHICSKPSSGRTVATGAGARNPSEENSSTSRRRGKRDERCSASRPRRFGLKPGNPLLLLAHKEAESLDMLRHVPVG
jgi:hypothetical protein